MKHSRFLALAAGAALVLAAGVSALAQDGLLAGLAQPVVVNIEQQVPVDVTLALPQADGAVVTATAPITVDIALQVKIDGAGVVSVVAGEAEPAKALVEATAPSGTSLDKEGRTYTTEVPEGLEITQLESKVNALDDIELIGEVRNTGDAALEYVEVVATFYGADGSIVEVASTYLDLDMLEPGQAAPFKMLPNVPGADVTEYKLQVKP